MAITDWPREERPREKLLQKGATALSDAELLAIFLRTGTREETAVVLAHNHSSGIAEPGEADQNITKQLSKGLALVDIRVLDHLVVGDGETVSMTERGLV